MEHSKPPEVFFDVRGDCYWIRYGEAGDFFRLSERKVKRHLTFSGVESVETFLKFGTGGRGQGFLPFAKV